MEENDVDTETMAGDNDVGDIDSEYYLYPDLDYTIDLTQYPAIDNLAGHNTADSDDNSLNHITSMSDSLSSHSPIRSHAHNLVSDSSSSLNVHSPLRQFISQAFNGAGELFFFSLGGIDSNQGVSNPAMIFALVC